MWFNLRIFTSIENSIPVGERGYLVVPGVWRRADLYLAVYIEAMPNDYDSDLSPNDQAVLAACLEQWNVALDSALGAARSAHTEIRACLDEVAKARAREA